MRLQKLGIPLLALLAACSDPHARSTAQPVEPLPLAQPMIRPPVNGAEMKMSFAPVVRKAAPAVVNVYSRRVVRQQVDPFWQMFGGGMGIPQERIAQSLGSGAIVRADGVVVTNNHVIEGGQEIMVVLGDRREFPAKLLLADPRADLAVLQIDTKGERLPTLVIDDKTSLEVGDLVLAIGDPFAVGQTVTNGIISGLARTQVGESDFNYFIQTDAAINPGNSGGPLVDMNGDLVGLNTFILSRSGSSSGVGFAIPAQLVKQVVESALGGGHSVVRPWLGAKGQAVDADIARSMGLDRPQGVLVAEVYPGAAADRAGLKSGDVIFAIDDTPVNDDSALAYQVATRRPGSTIQLHVRRVKENLTLNVRAEPAPGDTARDERAITGRNPLGGASVVNLSPAVALDLGVDPFAAKGGGVLVTKVDQDGFAARAGVRPGDLVRDVNGKPIKTAADLAAAVSGSSGTWRVTIQRGDQTITGQFRM